MLLLSLLPKDNKLRLCVDGTEWDFGQHQVNILLVVDRYRGSDAAHPYGAGDSLQDRALRTTYRKDYTGVRRMY
jgi:hypothetical protein